MSAEFATEVTPTRRHAPEPTRPWPAVPSVAARVIADLGLESGPRDPVKAASTPPIHPVPHSSTSRSSAPSAREAQRTATVLLSEYAATVRALESVPGSLVPRAELVVVDAPGPAARVTVWGTSIPVVLLCAALIGLVLGSTAAVLRSIFDNSAANGATPRKSTRWRLSGPPAPTCPLTLLLSGWEPRKATCLERTEAIGEGDRLNLKQFLAAVRRYWVTFVLVTAAVSAFGLTWILLSPAKFVSSTQLMVSIAGSTTAAAYQNDEVVAGRINSYIPLLTSGVVAQRVIDTLGLPLTASETCRQNQRHEGSTENGDH